MPSSSLSQSRVAENAGNDSSTPPLIPPDSATASPAEEAPEQAIPNIASWNVCHLDAATVKRMNEIARRFDVAAWLLQDWQPRSSGSQDISVFLDSEQRAFLGDRTAIICNDPLWIVDKVSHTTFSTMVTTRMSEHSDPFTLVSIYLPANMSGRLHLAAKPEFRSLFFPDDAPPDSVLQAIIMGDFNEQESVSDSLNAAHKKTSLWPQILGALNPLVPVL